MMGIPTFVLEGRKLPRVILAWTPTPPHPESILALTHKAYDLGVACFDLPTPRHLEAFRELKALTEDDSLIGIGHLDAEEGVSLLGRPLHQFESGLAATLQKNLFPPHLIRTLKERGLWTPRRFFDSPISSEVLTQKEIDRISFDLARFDRALSRFRPTETPYLLIGERYGDWLLGLGRSDLLQKMIARAKERGFIPIFSANWTTFALPKARPLEAAAYAVPINRAWSFFSLDLASRLVKKFDRCLIGLSPFGDGKLLVRAREALSFLFEELKIPCVIAEMASEQEGRRVLKVARRFPSLTPHKRT